MLGSRLAFATVCLLFTGLHFLPGWRGQGASGIYPHLLPLDSNHVGADDILYTNVRILQSK
jgi:hypothetical protein